MASGKDFELAIRRVTQGEFFTPMAVDGERSTLSKLDPPIEEPHVQDYVVWRRSLLLLAAVLFVLHAIFLLVNYSSFESIMTDGAVEEQSANGELSAEQIEHVRRNVVANVGDGNLSTLEIWNVVSALAAVAIAILVVLAAWKWLHVAASRRLARSAFFVSLITPLALCVIPWSSLLDFTHLGPKAEMMTKTLAFLFSLQVFFALAPKLVSIFPGLMRAGMMLKTMFHESPTPAYVTVLAAPVFMMMLLIMFSTMIQLEGKWTIMLGLLCLLLSAGIYLIRARDLVRVHSKDEAIRSVQSAGFISMVFSGLGVVLIAIYVFSMEGIDFLSALNFFVLAGANLLLTMAVASDYMLAGLSRQYAASKAFIGTNEAADYERKMGALEAAGMTRMATPAVPAPSSEPVTIESNPVESEDV